MKKIYLSILMAFSFFSTIFAANIVVTNNGDSGAGTLRQAIADAVDGDEITFNLSSGNETIAIGSQLLIEAKGLSIDGSNTAGSGTPVTVQVSDPGVTSSRVFGIIAEGKTINISNLTMKGGNMTGNNGGVVLISGGELFLTNCDITSGKAKLGGGLHADGNSLTNITITECSITGNTATWSYPYAGEGAGIYATDNSSNKRLSLVIKNSLIANNNAESGGRGGGIAIRWSDKLTIENSTISDNTGDGIYAVLTSITKVVNSTISGNTYYGFYCYDNIHYIHNSILINNTSGDITMQGTASANIYYSWHNNTSGTINSQADAPNITTAYTAGDLLALADNGGPTQTVAVAETAPAFENGNFAYYNVTDGYYFQDENNAWHKLTDWSSSPTSSDSDKITNDQRGETRNDPTTIGACDGSADPSNYYRTASIGDWSSTSTWEVSTDQTNWVAATETPTASNSDGIIINHNISVDADVSIDQTTVESGATLTIPTGVTLTVADGSDTDLTVNGALVINGTISTGTGAVDINPGGAIDASSGSITFTDAGYLYLGGTTTSLGTFTKSTSTVSYDATSVQTIHPLSYYKLELSGSDKYFSPGTTKVDQQIDIDYSVVIGGMGTAETVTIQVTDPGTTVSKVFNIDAPGETVTIQNMTLKGGNTGSSTGAYGGVVALAGGSLNLTNCVVSSGTANQGGGLHLADNTCSATINGCTFSDNTASGSTSYPPFGGGICSNYGNLTIKNSLIANNSKVGSGGMGAGISINNANITIENSTIADNTGTGVDLESGTTANILNTTISGNTDNGINCGGGEQYILNSIMINNGSKDIRIVYVTPEIYYSWYDPSKVQIYQSGGIGGIIDQADAPNITTAYTTGDLLALADNGGSTQTMAVAETAPAAGNGAFAYYNATDGYYFQDDNSNWHKLTNWSSAPTYTESDKITTDQRGETRGTPTTIGAYDLGAVPPIYVDADNTSGTQDGTKWATAYQYLQDALAAATSGDQIWVADGTYYPDEGTGITDNDREESFQITSGISVYGGFDGTETALNERDLNANVCILSGDIGTASVNSDNSYHVVYFENAGNQTMLDGFSISYGNANHASTDDYQRGGGIYNKGTGSGNSSNPQITNCKISGNTAKYGGGIYNAGHDSGESSPTLINCVLSGNYASGGYGGAVYNGGYSLGNSSPTLINCVISACKSTNGGAIYNDGYSGGESSPVLTNTIIWGNSTSIAGGGNDNPVYNYCDIEGGVTGGTGNINSDPLFVDMPDATSAPTTDGDFRIFGDSPCVNVGNNSANSLDKDIRGEDRIQNTTIDMGAYEYTEGTDPMFNIPPFVLVYTTTDPNSTIYLNMKGTVDAIVNWGDGSSNQSFNTEGNHGHTFVNAGTYTVQISGSLSGFGGSTYAYRQQYLTSVSSFGEIGLEDLSYAFYNATNLSSVPSALPTSPNITNLQGCFRYANSFNGDISAWDVSEVTDMSKMFNSASSFNQNIGNWATGNVTNMESMFEGADAFNQNLTGWQTANVTNMTKMFRSADVFNGDIGNWDVSQVTSMQAMFENAYVFNRDIGNWSPENVTDMSNMFEHAHAFNQDLNNWDVSSVTTLYKMFKDTEAFNGNISGWNTENVTTLERMFENADAFNRDITGWNTSNVTRMDYMFYNAQVFNGDISDFTTGSVTNMSGMFSSAEVFDQDISGWNTGNVTNMSSMFNNADAFNQDIGNWNSANVTNLSSMFNGATMFNQDIGNWNTANVTNMSNMFRDAAAFNQDIGNWNTANVTSMSYMFYGATTFNQNISSWNTSIVTNMWAMFKNASAFNQDLGNWQIDAVEYMEEMLDNSGLDCSSYSTTLQGWSDYANTPSGVTLNATGLTYGTDAVTYRNDLTNNKGWTISGDIGGTSNCLCTNPSSGGTIAESQIVCSGSTPDAFTNIELPSGHTGDLEYKWQMSTTSGTSGFSDINSSNSEVYNPGAITTTTWYKRLAKVDCMPDWAGAASSNVLEITYYPNAFSAGEIETNGETVCYLGDPIEIGSIIDASGGDENITYKWQYASDEAFTNPFDISNSNSPTFDPPAGADMTYWYRRLAKDESCNTDFTPSEGNWKVTVLNAFVVGSISGDQTFCESGTPNEFAGIPPTGGSTPYSYQWQSSTDGVNFTDISGANEINYQAGEISDTTYFRLQQTSAEGCGSEFTNTIAVYIHFLCCDELDNYCQSPDIENTEAYVSDESGPTIIFDNFWGVTDGITDIEWWGTTEDGSGIYCEENPKQFKITFYNDDNGSPGTSYQNASYDVSVTGTYTGSHFGPNNNPVIHYEFKLTPAFSGLTNGWVSIEGYPGGSCKFAWLTSSNGDGLSYINGSKNVSDKDFSFGLKFSPTIPIDNWALYLSFILIALFIVWRTYKPFS